MAKRRRTTGLPQAQAVVGGQVPRLNRYTGHQCPGCPLHGTCLDTEVPGGPWQVMQAQPQRAVTCRVKPSITMVPVEVLRVKEDHAPAAAPVQPRREETNVLLDANALIEGAKGTFPGLIELLIHPPEGFCFYTTDEVHREVRFLRGLDRDALFEKIQIVAAPAVHEPRLAETHGDDINPPSPADMGLFQLALSDDRFHIIVSHDRYHRRAGLPHTLGIAHRLKVYGVDDFIRYAKRRR